jgi:hypothetical protein
MAVPTMTISRMDGMLPIQQRVYEFIINSIQQCLLVCDQFLDAQRVFLKSPSASELIEHRLALSLIIRTARTWQGLVLDPDFPDRSIARQLEIRLRQLEESWSLFYNPMPQSEADSIIESTFPNER